MRSGGAGVDLDRRIVTFNRLAVPAYAVKDLPFLKYARAAYGSASIAAS